MDLILFNTLARKKEVFKPIKRGKVGMYSCGPTVYSYQHIGNMRAYIFSDLLKRTLLFNKYKVTHIINVTDVGHLTSDADEGDDKMEKASTKEGKSAKEISNFYFNAFKSDIIKLNIIFPDKWTKATDHINEQINLIKKLEKKGYTYRTSDGIYFDSSKFKDYGKIALLKIKNLKAGKRVNMGEKRHKTDFALWKFSEEPRERQQEWDSPWGIGFPGWHIECSAMSMKYLGEHFDIHTGGEDHISIHHTNEIAQSECATGKKFVNYWLHTAFLTLNNQKMSKSKGSIYTLSELEYLGYSPEHYRYLNLLTHYRKNLSFNIEGLEAAKSAFEKLKRKILEIETQTHKALDLTDKYEAEFLKSINDDLNIPRAVQTLWKVVDDFDFIPEKKLKLIKKFDEVLGLGIKDFKEEKLNIPGEIKKLVDSRERLRKNKLWAEADIIRNRIQDLGFKVLDTESGPKIEKI